MIFLKLILTNLRRHRIRSVISVAGIAFSVAAMLTIVTILQGAIGMFSGILSSDSEIIVFERNVSDLFFSNVPATAAQEIAGWSRVQHADPVLFGIVSSSDHPIITCFGITPADARLRNASWLQGDRANFAQHSDDVVVGERSAEFLKASLGSYVQIGHGTFHVIGILKTANGFEDGGVFMPLNSAQSFFHKEGSSSVVTIKLHNKEDASAFKSMVKAKYISLHWRMRSSPAPTRSSRF
jgi:putative ABC transport system permease protein